MDTVAELPAWLRALEPWLRLLEPLSVPFVILLMLAGWLLEVRRDRARRRRYDARFRARAFALALLLDNWMHEWPEWAIEGQREHADGEEVARATGKLAERCPEAREILEDMVDMAPDASEELAEVVEEAYPLMLEVIRQIETIEDIASREPRAITAREAPAVLATFHKDVVEVFNLLHPHTLDFRQHTWW